MIAVIFSGKLNALIQSALSWSRQSLSAHEELSCSYQPSKRKREDVIQNHLKNRELQSMMSDDVTDNDSLQTTNTSQYIGDDNDRGYDDNDIDDVSDAYELRHRLRNTLRSNRYVKPVKEPLQLVA